MEYETALAALFAALDTLGHIARMMHPARLPDLIAELGDRDASLRAAIDALPQTSAVNEQIAMGGTLALQACAGLRAAPGADNPTLEAYRAMRQYSRSQEALAALVDTIPSVSHFLLEPHRRDDPELRRRVAGHETGIFHSGNRTDERGGFSVIVPPGYDPTRPTAVVFALHGGAGHGRLFLWNWLPEARSRDLIIVAPTAIGGTWSLMEPEIDSQNLATILQRVQDRWNIDPNHILLSGMSDGGTFTLLSGLAEACPFTHLAPVASSFHPMLLAMSVPERLTGLPIHLTHGAQDWMFPVSGARTAHRMLAAAGARITYREIADLSHAYPRDGQGEVLDWFLEKT